MAYQVLARKWRPKTFADLVGQEHVAKALQNALDKGRLHHAYLLTGTRGVGKTTIARILAKSLNCENATHGEPCGVCSSCTQIDAGRYVDLLEIDAASNTGIDNIREVLENAQYAPTAGRYKVYIIDEVHMLSKSAFNAMLKTLEEPPEHVKFILATTDPHKVPITVLSRCLQFVLRNMTTQQVAGHLAYVLHEEEIEYEPAALQLLGRAAEGSMRDALSLLDQAISLGSGRVMEQDVRQMIGAVDKQYLYELLQALVTQNGDELLAKAQEMAARSIGFDSALNELAMLLQRLALIQTVPSALADDDPERGVLQQLAQSLHGEQIQLYYQCVIRGKQDLSFAPDEYAGFVMTLLRMLAFAPLAAQKHAVGGTIEHTQLNDAETDVKKPEIQTASAQIEPTAQTVLSENRNLHSEKPAESKPANEVQHHAQTQDLPPWEEPAAPQVETPQTETQTQFAAQNIQIEAETGDAEYSELTVEAFAEKHFAADAEIETDSAADGDEETYVLPTEAVLPETATDFAAEDDDDVDDEPVFAALPPFQPENWSSIVHRFAAKLGAAQMVAQQAAWVAYDENSRLMTLALTQQARATVNKERLDKIQDTLTQAYGIVLKLQTEPWRDDAGWETPMMRDKRLQQEGRQQAEDILNADATAQQIMQAFEAQWQPDTLMLKSSIV